MLPRKDARGKTSGRLDLYETKPIEKQSLDPSVHVIVRAGPRADAPKAGWAAMTVAVRSPIHKVNGFEELLFPNGKLVWIASNP